MPRLETISTDDTGLGKCISMYLNFCICKMGLLHRTIHSSSDFWNSLWFLPWFPEGELSECSRMNTLSFPTFTQASSGMEEQLSLLVISGMELNQLCTSSIRKALLYPHWPQGESVGSFMAPMTQSEEEETCWESLWSPLLDTVETLTFWSSWVSACLDVNLHNLLLFL